MLEGKDRVIEDLNKKISDQNGLLEQLYAQIEALKIERRTTIKRYRCHVKQLTEFIPDNRDRLHEEPGDEDDMDITALNEMVELISKGLRQQKEETGSQLKNLMLKNKKVELEREELVRQVESLMAENSRLVREIAGLRPSGLQNTELLRSLENTRMEKKQLIDKVTSLTESLKDLDNSFKETRWALTSEVAEKHDQIQELRRCVSALEEQLRQADKQTHFKDDIIKEMRKELKISRKSERRGLYDVVTELKATRKKQKNETSMSSSPTQNPDACDPSVSNDEMMTPPSELVSRTQIQGQLESLREDLKRRIDQIQAQEEMTKELEDDLRQTRKDLSALQEKYENGSSDSNLNQTDRCVDRLLSALVYISDKMEGILLKLSKNCDCKLCQYEDLIEEEMAAIQCVKKDLASLSPQSKQAIQFNDDSLNDESELDEAKMQINQLKRTIAEMKGEGGGEAKCNLFHVNDLETFRVRAVTGVAALEEMKDQIDNLSEIVKKHLDKAPDCEKCQIEACEMKYDKFHDEFEEMTDHLQSFIEKLLCRKDDDIPEELESLEEKSKIEDDQVAQMKDLVPLVCERKKLIEETSRLKNELDSLQNEVEDHKKSATSLKNLHNETAEQVRAKQAEVEQYNEVITGMDGEMTKLRESVKGFVERLREMQIKVAEEPQDETLKGIGKLPDSVDTVSALSLELQQLTNALCKTGDVIISADRLKDELQLVNEKITSYEKLLCNKDETIRLQQSQLKMRERQNEDLRQKIEDLENNLSKLTKEIEEKCRVIAGLQEAVRNCKQYELKLKEDQIESLQFELCDLDIKLKIALKEILQKDHKMEAFQDENVCLRAEIFDLKQETELMEPKLKTSLQNGDLLEKVVSHLQEELKSRETEIECQRLKIQELEEELEKELRNCEERASEDLECIAELNVKVKCLQDELHRVRKSYELALGDAEHRLTKERTLASEQTHESEMKASELTHVICQLRAENKVLKKQLKDWSVQDEISAKVSDLESILKRGESRHQLYNEKLCELQKRLEETLRDHECEKEKLMQKLNDEMNENLKCRDLITRLKGDIRRRAKDENSLRECLEHFTDEIEALTCENRQLKSEVETRRKQMMIMESMEFEELNEIEELVSTLKTQKKELKARNFTLKTELDRQICIKEHLEQRIDQLDDSLGEKGIEYNVLCQNHKSTTSNLQQTLKKLKETGEKLNLTRDELDKRGEECALTHERYLEMKRVASEERNTKLYAQYLLNEKKAECIKLTDKLEELQAVLNCFKTEKADQSSKDFDVKRLSHKIKCLEGDLSTAEENYRRASGDCKKAQEELVKSAEREACIQAELTAKEKDWSRTLKSASEIKNDLISNIDELERQLEAKCEELACREKQNKALVQESAELRCHLDKLKCEVDALRKNYRMVVDNLKSVEKKKANYEKLLSQNNLENMKLQEVQVRLEDEICELTENNTLLKEKLKSLTKFNSPEVEEFVTERTNGAKDEKKICKRVKELAAKLKSYEKCVIPELDQEIIKRDKIIDCLRVELQDTNICNEKMRNESLKVLENTKKYLAAQQNANEGLRKRLNASNEEKQVLGNENKELDEQLKAITRMNNFLLCELRTQKEHDADGEPRTYSPLPWGCAVVERDGSPEYHTESGFQSMQNSPTNLVYDTKEFKHELKKTASQWYDLRRQVCSETGDYPSSVNNFVK